jgi:hypothetical protein
MKATAKKWLLPLCFLLCSLTGFAQEQAEMADVMRSNGKIYVVVAVLMVVLVGLILYVFALDRKIRKLEKNSDINS